VLFKLEPALLILDIIEPLSAIEDAGFKLKLTYLAEDIYIYLRRNLEYN